MIAPGTDYRFKRSNRLLQSSDFQAVFSHPDYRVSSGPLLFLARENHPGVHRLGVIVGRRRVRRAVDRARIKRIARETFRHRPAELAGLDIIILVRARMDHPPNRQLHDQMTLLWQRLLAKRGQA